MKNANLKIGIVNVTWDYDDLNEKRQAFYELTIDINNENYTFINNYYFLKNNVCVSTDYTKTNIFKFDVLEYLDNDIIKVNLCGDILYINQQQYNLINEKTADIQIYLKDNNIIKKEKL